MIKKSLDDLILEEFYSIVLEDQYTREQAIEILNRYGVKNAGKLSLDELKSMYRKLASRYHPDVGGNHQDFIKIFSAIESLKANPAYTQTQSQSQSRPQPQSQPYPPRSYTLPYCPKCKAKTYSPDANYCVKCGEKIRLNY